MDNTNAHNDKKKYNFNGQYFRLGQRSGKTARESATKWLKKKKNKEEIHVIRKIREIIIIQGDYLRYATVGIAHLEERTSYDCIFVAEVLRERKKK